MTQEEVAAHLGVSRPTVAQIEAGNRMVSSLELGKLAYLFGRDIRDLLGESFEEVDTLAALFRAQPDVIDQPEVVERIRQCMALGREITNLERLLGIEHGQPAVASYVLPVPSSRWEAVQHGQRLADEERLRLGLGTAPLPELAELLESQGVRTGNVDLPDDVSGLTLSDRDVGVFVIVNRIHSERRRRFSFAHEYAHVLGDRDRSGLVSRSSEREDLREVRANAFAANFLMPDAGTRQFIAGLGKGRPSRTYAEVFDEVGSLEVEGRTVPRSQDLQLYDVVQLAHHFGVSRLAALYRLRNLRVVNEAEFEHLKRLDDEGKGKQLAEQLDRADPTDSESRNEFRHRFLSLALEAYRRDEISRGKLTELAAMVKLNSDDVDRILGYAELDDDAPQLGHTQ